MTMSAELTATRVPDFFIVGHPKCGTTALYEMLRRHPQIYMPELKEPRYLASDLRQRFQPPRSGSLPASMEEYLALFQDARPEQRAGEASPSYLASHTAAGLIAELQPDARVIAIVREPAAFLRSLHLQLLRSHVESEKDLRKALALERDRGEGRNIPPRSHRPQALQYSDNVRYVQQLRRYHEVLAPERVLVLIYDDFRSDNEATVRRVLRFLDVDHTAPIELLEVNPMVAVRSQQLEEMVHSISIGRGAAARAVQASLKRMAPRALRRRALRVLRRRVITGGPPPVDERLMADLRSRFKAEVVALSEYLDRDLVSLWGYDNVN
jgi:hypothetical protein